MTQVDVVVVGAGPAGLSAAVFTARNELDTVVVEDGYAILRRNAHLENFLGFPAGVNSRLLLDMGIDQVQRNGADYVKDTVEHIEQIGDGFRISLTEGEDIDTRYVIVASWANTFYLDDLDVETYDDGSKTFIDTDAKGRTSVDGLYAAGRIAGQYHQTLINAGHGATVAVTLLEAHDPDFYHDWVAPEGYFTGRDRDVPKGCEEISEAERKRREKEAMETMQDYFSEPYEPPRQHPSVKKQNRDTTDQ